ncbi:unnamed protein product [Rotaria magnacalcarata]
MMANESLQHNTVSLEKFLSNRLLNVLSNRTKTTLKVVENISIDLFQTILYDDTQFCGVILDIFNSKTNKWKLVLIVQNMHLNG